VDIVRAAAGRARIEVEFVAVPFEQVQRTLEDGRAEAVFPLTITPERLPLFDFSAPFLVTGERTGSWGDHDLACEGA
jgi:polar amino acid transport system substrate-binding protein